MSFYKEINLFELTDKVINRFRSESGLILSGYEFEFKFKRDWNCPINRININLFIFGENHAHTYFDEQYDTVDKVVNLLFVHLRDDAGIEDLKEGMITAKRHSVESLTESLTKKIMTLSKDLYEPKGYEPLIVMVDEKYPYEYFYENGFPVMQYQVYSMDNSIKLYFDLDYYLRTFDENEVLRLVKDEIKKAPDNV